LYPTDEEAKEMIISIGKRMVQSSFVTANDGNITIRVNDDAVWATPTGVNKGDLTTDKLIKIAIHNGEVIEGSWRPTSELKMHLNVYRTDNEIMSTVHAHPLNLTVLACAGIELDLPTTPAACAISGRVPVVPYRCSGTEALADSVIPYVTVYNVVNLANHGPIAWGRNSQEAWFRLEDAEASAHLALKLLELGRFRPICADQVQEIFRFHHVYITEQATVHAYSETDNQEPATPFSQFMREYLAKGE